MADAAKVPEGVLLHLSTAEAQTLADLFMSVGGLPETTRRGLIDKVLEALVTVGFTGNVTDTDTRGSVHFQERTNPRYPPLPKNIKVPLG